MHSRRTQFIASFACIAVIALICAVLLPSAQHSSARVDGDPSAPPAQAPATNDAAAQLKAAVDGIGNDAGYRFNATIEQALTPRAVSGMLGQQTQHVTLWLDGEREPAESRFSVRVNGASGGQAARFVARNGQLFIQKDDTLEPVQGGADSAMLPATRMSDFLRAAEGVSQLLRTARR